MDQDRTLICNVISKMLDNPDNHGLYCTSTAYTELEHYIESQRIQTLGWAHAYMCTKMDQNQDIRLLEVPSLLQDFQQDFNLDLLSNYQT